MPDGKKVNLALRYSSPGTHTVKGNGSVARFAHALYHLLAKALAQVTQSMHKPSNACPLLTTTLSLLPTGSAAEIEWLKELHFNSKDFPVASHSNDGRQDKTYTPPQRNNKLCCRSQDSQA